MIEVIVAIIAACGTIASVVLPIALKARTQVAQVKEAVQETQKIVAGNGQGNVTDMVSLLLQEHRESRIELGTLMAQFDAHIQKHHERN